MFTVLAAPRATARLAVTVVAPALLLAACGSTPGYGTASSSSGSATAGTAKVATRSGDLGTYLTDGSGRSLYLFAADTGGTSTCTGACAAAWLPLTTKSAPVAASGAKSSMLGTTTRTDGSKQVVYGGHPLYYFTGDSAPGDTTGEGFDEFGAQWWLVTPAGASVPQGGTTSTSPSGGSKGSYGY